MADRILLTRFSRQLDRERILAQLNCAPDGYARTELEYCCEQLEPFFWNKAAPKAVIAFTTAPSCLHSPYLQPGDAVAYLMSTIGGGVEQLAKLYFDKKDYLSGMVLHAMADAYLFAMEPQLKKRLKEACNVRKVGVSKRLEAPANLPIESQNIAVQETDANRLLGVSLTEGMMLTPVKSCWFLVKLTSDQSMFCVEHNCADCKNTNCLYRTCSDSH